MPPTKAIEASALDGHCLAWSDSRTVPVPLLMSGNHTELISLCVISSPSVHIVLDYPWLEAHNPQIDWNMGAITQWSSLFLL